MSASAVFALRKQGRSAEALELARTAYPDNATDIWFARAYAWTLYDEVKALVERYETKQISPAALSGQLSPCMREFARMAGPLRGDSAFSQMLRLAGKASKDWDAFLGFAQWAGVQDFMDEDKKPFVNEQGKTVDSLQTRFVRAVCRETAACASRGQGNPAWIEWGKSVLEDALQRDPLDQWLNYYQSKLYLAQGEPDQAVRHLLPVLRRQPRAAWPWALLGETLEITRPDDALVCYAHATQLAREEQEVAKVRIHLAQRLSLAGRLDEAARQAALALAYREQHGYKVPQALAQLVASDWYRQAVEENRMRPLRDAAADARALLQALGRDSLAYIPGVIDHINREKALSYIATGAATGFGLAHRKHPQLAELAPGTLVEVGLAGPEGPAVDWRLSEAKALPGLCETFAGSVNRHEDQDFAFIRAGGQDIFVPPALAREFAPGQQYEVSCLAIRRTNKHGKTGWRAVDVGNANP